MYFWGSRIYGENEVNRQDLLLCTAHLYLFKTPLKKLFKKDYKTIKSYFKKIKKDLKSKCKKETLFWSLRSIALKL